MSAATETHRAEPASPPSGSSFRVVRSVHGPRLAVDVIVVAVLLFVVYRLGSSPAMKWGVVREYLFAEPILRGVLSTLKLTGVSMVIGLALGIAAAIARLSPNPVASVVASLYVWFFRGTPLLVQLLFWFFLSALLPTITLGLPFGGPSVATVSTNSVISPFMAAIIGLGVNEGAYMAEIVRGGLLSIPRGQTEAAQALGMTRSQVLRRIVLPQAMRVIVPPTGNQVIGLLKNTSLVIVIGYSDLLTSASLIYASNFQTIPLLVVAAIWYLAVTVVLSSAQHLVEKYYGRGYRASPVRAVPRPLAAASSAGSAQGAS